MARVAVIGGGAAGMMAAIFAAEGGAETLLLESTPDGGSKILISGGGRCNILPARLDETRFVTDSSPHTLRKIVRSWPLAEQRAFFEQDLGIPLAEEAESEKLFPVSNKARDVRDALLARAIANGARWMPDTMVTGVERNDAGWTIATGDGRAIVADSIVVATGGMSVPATGSDGRGLSWLRALGHTVHPTYAALTPVLANPHPFGELAGVSLTVTLTASDTERRAVATGGFLFTHRGYSGPAALDVSHVLVRSSGNRARLLAQWTSMNGEAWDKALRPAGPRNVATLVREQMPARLADALLAMAGIAPDTQVSQLKRESRAKLVGLLTRCELPWTGHGGYAKAEVTGGGVSLAEIDPRTMESRKHAGLYICGEALDAFGPIGGYNFLWAWVTGRAAGRATGLALRGRGAAPTFVP
ncbi:MAG: NAD(P)/FAD-dependent oxidoreductase [Gemmatimonadales bacterium]